LTTAEDVNMMSDMKVLVACEFSGIVRDAFKARGHDAWSCDLRATDKPGQHIQGDVLEILDDGWDLMVAHPPCTYISYASTRLWNDVGRCKLRLDALDFFMKQQNLLGYGLKIYPHLFTQKKILYLKTKLTYLRENSWNI